MTNQEKLTKLIEIVVENGYNKVDGKAWIHSIENDIPVNQWWLFFNHDFAKAIWGEAGIHCTNCHTSMFVNGSIGYSECCERWCDSQIKYWEWHLQQAVISKDPLGYYWENK